MHLSAMDDAKETLSSEDTEPVPKSMGPSKHDPPEEANSEEEFVTITIHPSKDGISKITLVNNIIARRNNKTYATKDKETPANSIEGTPPSEDP